MLKCSILNWVYQIIWSLVLLVSVSLAQGQQHLAQPNGQPGRSYVIVPPPQQIVRPGAQFVPNGYTNAGNYGGNVPTQRQQQQQQQQQNNNSPQPNYSTTNPAGYSTSARPTQPILPNPVPVQAPIRNQVSGPSRLSLSQQPNRNGPYEPIAQQQQYQPTTYSPPNRNRFQAPPAKPPPKTGLPGKNPNSVGSSSEELEEYEDEQEPDRLTLLLQESKFVCPAKKDGYYADETLNCEVFHYCQDGAKHSWMCPNNFAFHQVHLICVPPSSDNICKQSTQYHFVNEYLYRPINEKEAAATNTSLKYADRYYPDGYTPGLPLDEMLASYDQSQGPPAPKAPASFKSRPSRPTSGGGIDPRQNVFYSPESINIPLSQRRPIGRPNVSPSPSNQQQQISKQLPQFTASQSKERNNNKFEEEEYDEEY